MTRPPGRHQDDPDRPVSGGSPYGPPGYGSADRPVSGGSPYGPPGYGSGESPTSRGTVYSAGRLPARTPVRGPRPAAPRQRDWLVIGAVGFLGVAVLVGVVLGVQGLLPSGSSPDPRVSATGQAAPGARASSAAPSPTPSPEPSVVNEAVPGKPAQLQATHSGLCLETPPRDNPDGVPAVQNPCSNAPTQLWTLTPVQGSDTYTLINSATNRCLDLNGGNDNDGTPIQAWACHGGPNQQWRLNRTASGTYRLLSKSNKCLDVSGAKTDPGTPLIQSGCHDGGNQQWTFITKK